MVTYGISFENPLETRHDLCFYTAIVFMSYFLCFFGSEFPYQMLRKKKKEFPYQKIALNGSKPSDMVMNQVIFIFPVLDDGIAP